MKFHIVEHPQRSAAWFIARSGRLTGSRAADMLAKIKSGEAAARRDYRLQLAVERLTGTPQENGYVSPEMERGIALEATAFAAYEAATGEMVRRTGFICADDHMVGCSLDGDIENFKGIIELKVPKSTTHISYFKSNGLPSNYLPQVQHNLWVTNAEWCDFVSFDDRLPKSLQMFKVRVYAKFLDMELYQSEAMRFLAEVDAEVKSLAAIKAVA